MNQQDTINQSGIIGIPHPQTGQTLNAAMLNDLPLNETSAAEVKAGIAGGTSAAAGEFPYIVSFQNTAVGSGTALHLTPTNELSSNHNESVAEDEATGTDLLADLPVKDAKQIKGGSTLPPPGTGKTLTSALLGK